MQTTYSPFFYVDDEGLFICAFFHSPKTNEWGVFVSNNKINLHANLMSQYEHIFQCPICSKPMKTVQLKSLICVNHHCFDLSKDGYIYLVPHKVRTKYDQELFAARKRISSGNFFEHLITQISQRILKESGSGSEMIRMLDAGCGEGSHLSETMQKIQKQTLKELLGVGIDISKEGIRLAAKSSPAAVWCVADLANCPFDDKQFDYILNVLSPASYAEFQRLLNDDGMIIKVVPGSMYLQEIRKLLYKEPDKQQYSNEHTTELFNQKFALVDTQQVRYEMMVDSEYLEHLIRMTPLSWGAPELLIRRSIARRHMRVTFDFNVLYGKKK